MNGENRMKNNYWIYGTHAVLSALENPKRKIHKVLINKGLEIKIPIKNLPLEMVDKTKIENLFPFGTVHQGIAALVSPLEDYFLDEILREAKEDSLIIILDQVSDPHNIGAIIRSALAFKALCLIMQDKNAPDETATMVKSSAGAIEKMPIVRVKNLSQSIKEIQENGFWVIGLDGNAKEMLHKMNLKGKTALVLGSEGSGIRRLVGENCDCLAKLPISDNIESLNVSTAAAIAMYEVRRN